MSNVYPRIDYSSDKDAVRNLSVSINRAISQTPFNTVKTVTADYMAAEYNVILCDCTAGQITISLPRGDDYNGSYTIKKIDSSVNAVVIDAYSTETIDGAATISFSTQYLSYTIVTDDSKTRWFIV